MIRIISVAFVLALASSSTQAMPLTPIEQPDSMVTKVVAACGVGRTRVNGVCVPTPQTASSQVCTMEWKHLRCVALLLNRHRDRSFGADWSKREAASIGGLIHIKSNT